MSFCHFNVYDRLCLPHLVRDSFSSCLVCCQKNLYERMHLFVKNTKMKGKLVSYLQLITELDSRLKHETSLEIRSNGAL